MMVSPEVYCELFLQGKSSEEIREQIRYLEEEIRQLKETPEKEDWMICPDRGVQLKMARAYLKKARQALSENSGK